MTTQEILEASRSAKSALSLADNTARNAALLGIADALCSADNQAAILTANAEDMAAAKGHISDVMLDLSLIHISGRYLLTNQNLKFANINWTFFIAGGVVVVLIGIAYVCLLYTSRCV